MHSKTNKLKKFANNKHYIVFSEFVGMYCKNRSSDNNVGPMSHKYVERIDIIQIHKKIVAKMHLYTF